MRLLLLALLYPTQPTTEATITVVPLPLPYPGRSPTIIEFSSASRPIGIAKAIVIFRSGGRHDGITI